MRKPTVKIFEFSVKAFAALLKSFAGGNRKLGHTGRKARPSALSGRGGGGGWMWSHTDCLDSGSSAMKMITPAAVVKKKTLKYQTTESKRKTIPKLVYFEDGSNEVNRINYYISKNIFPVFFSYFQHDTCC